VGLRDVVAKRKAERERPKTLAELRAAKKESSNNHDKPKSLAELRKRKQAVKPPRSSGLAALRESKQRTPKRSKDDFHRAGVRFHNVQQYDGYWTVDVSNGDKTFTLHNKHGAWYHDVQGRDRYMVEPVTVARALGTDMSQLEITQSVIHRLELELKARGLPTREQLLRQREEEAKQQRRKQRKHSGEEQDD
jgi:hypothetical protein